MTSQHTLIPRPRPTRVERVQIGVRLESSIANTLKLLAKMDKKSLGELMEDIVSHAWHGHSTFPTAKPGTPRARAFRHLLKQLGYTYKAHTPLRFYEPGIDVTTQSHRKKIIIKRVPLGMRMEKRMVKALKALAELADLSLEQLLEDIVTHAFDGVSTFCPPSVKDPKHKHLRAKIDMILHVYDIHYGVHDFAAFEETLP